MVVATFLHVVKFPSLKDCLQVECGDGCLLKK
jgi:hypothetical protein